MADERYVKIQRRRHDIGQTGEPAFARIAGHRTPARRRFVTAKEGEVIARSHRPAPVRMIVHALAEAAARERG
jgi:hypothetical protein